MKKIIIFLYCLPFLTFAQTKLDRSKAPDPLKAKTINVESPQSFVMPNGLKVFVVQNTKLPTVSFTLLVDMLPIYYKYAGIEDLAGSMLKAGTRKYTKEKLDEEIEFLGGQINAGHNYISGNCLNNNFPKLFELFSDICLNPSFPKEELEKQKKQLLSNIESNKEDPNVIANNVRAVLMYGKNHPYGQIATKTSVEKIDVEDIVQNYNTYWKPSISYLVFVGDISLEEAKTLCNKYLNNWQGQAPEFVKYPFPTLPESRTVAIVNRPQSVQSVIGVFNAIDLKKSSPDRLATQVLNTVLGAHASSRLFMNLREKHGFTYGAYSRITDDRYVGNFRTVASVRNEKTDSAIGEFLNEIKRIRTEKVSPEELSFAVKYMSGEFSRSFESPNTIADFALNIERFNLPKDYYKNYLQSLDKITADQIEQAANKYLNLDKETILVVGKAEDIKTGLEKYGTIKYYDIDGNEEVNTPKKQAEASNMQPEDILQNAIKAMLNNKDINSLKDVSLEGTISFNGQTMKSAIKYLLPNKSSRIIEMNGMALMSQLITEDIVLIMQMGNEVPLPDDEKEEAKAGGYFFVEQYILDKKFPLTYQGIEAIDGIEAHVVEVKISPLSSLKLYYDIKTGFKIQEDENSKKGTNTVKYADYKEVNGFNIYSKTVILTQGLTLENTINNIKINQGLSASDFKK